ncbi:hypothetical protein GCM10018777_56700 [Streptomyces albogriseolus]|uniref:hypothetical protein n=1 Tax=Streptomyces albogriseolus TaxID=1887 RepID=UPI00167371F1|nr:hypothetical protein [Streptomyces viridodiastaticus]GHG33228.1 hypothetical protein GCM10018777_56700 [Streptomyces viridodiastaticus]
MNTTLAATEAGVSIDTVRTWCRIGAVAAVKQAGRWIIDAASLAARIAIGKMKRPAKKVVYSIETMTAIGGNRWTKAGHDRVYLNNWDEFAGLEVTRYNTGNISTASYQDQGISNSQAYKILGCIDKVWFDAADGKLHCRYGWGESRVASREEVWDAVVAGVRAAIAAL